MKTTYALASLLPAAYAAGSICTSGLYELFLPLSTYAPAQSYCQSKYPPRHVTINATAPAVTVTSSTVVPVTVTSYTTSTVQPAQKRDFAEEQRERREANRRRKLATVAYHNTTVKATATVNPGAVLFSALVAAASHELSMFCSCIEPTISTTTTKTPTATTTFTSTSTTTTTSVIITTAAPSLPADTCVTGLQCIDGSSFSVTCGVEESFTGYTGLSEVTAASFTACIQDCSNDPQCNGFTFNRQSLACDLYDNLVNQTPGYESDVMVDSGYYVGSC